MAKSERNSPISRGFMLAAPHSGSGKTTLTLGLLAHLSGEGIPFRSAKAGPDFLDPKFHELAGKRSCVNLDPWAMDEALIRHLANGASGHGDDTHGEDMPGDQGEPLIVEAMMGLFDGAADGTGSAADLARLLNLNVVLVVDAAKQSHSIAALVSGFAAFRDDITVAGVILNCVGSPRHEAMLREALAAISMPVLGCVFRDKALEIPHRHLGLMQPDEIDGMDGFLDHAAKVCGASLDVAALLDLKAPANHVSSVSSLKMMPPPGQSIAIARDLAFSFIYPHLLQQWREQGADICFFSPLQNEAPHDGCDAIYLPGGYPELHAEKLAGCDQFMSEMRAHAARGTAIFGECGGYMVLGEALIDAAGVAHKMTGLLPLTTSFAARKLSLGYRKALAMSDYAFAPMGHQLTAHEFHYSTVAEERLGDDGVERLFEVCDARGETLPYCGLRKGNVAGSYLHLIDRVIA